MKRDPVDARDEKGGRGELLEEACGTCSVCEEEEMQVFLFPCGHWACSGCQWRLDDGECGCDNCDPSQGSRISEPSSTSVNGGSKVAECACPCHSGGKCERYPTCCPVPSAENGGGEK